VIVLFLRGETTPKGPVGEPIQQLVVARERVERHGSRMPDG
jgi:hypothetical protein